MIGAYGTCVALVVDSRNMLNIVVRVYHGNRSPPHEKVVQKPDALRKSNGIILVNVRGFCRLHSIIIPNTTSKSGER